jgi:DnaJ-class molecular chaperone
LEDAILSEPIRLKTLDGRSIVVTLDEIISPQTIKHIPGEGMPVSIDIEEQPST